MTLATKFWCRCRGCWCYLVCKYLCLLAFVWILHVLVVFSVFGLILGVVLFCSWLDHLENFLVQRFLPFKARLAAMSWTIPCFGQSPLFLPYFQKKFYNFYCIFGFQLGAVLFVWYSKKSKNHFILFLHFISDFCLLIFNF